jgi:uncharacterized protein (DUF697 family)
MLVALNKIDQPEAGQAVEEARRNLACPVIGISAQNGEGLARDLLPRMVDVGPSLNTALGRESPVWRHMASRRATRRAALLCGLVGLEPVPFLDLPLQALLQARLVLRIAAIHDEPHDDRYSRELLAALIGGVGLRYAGQQLAKLVPVAGWLLSSALAAGGAWMIGLASEVYFAHGRRVPLPQLPSMALRARPRFGMPRMFRRAFGRVALGEGIKGRFRVKWPGRVM